MSFLQQAIGWRQGGKLKEAIELLHKITDQEPDHGEAWYQLAWAHDSLGLEREAVPYYEKALQLELSAEDRAGAILGLGSTYRTLAQYKQAQMWLLTGINEFPERREFEVFYAMVLYNLGEHAEAMQRLLIQLADTSTDQGISDYSRAIRYYADQLDRVWN
ncbi:tetratricopeptide repeat protein [Paenibacillus silvae]|jgi:tetratricopeptide (TPR) repeat protein|uniref:tetratricopeptide repeat protein n=1 Tax=Paenibacillus silvae TaxID=1325358 RepID=UPI0025A206A6|nr:tetratricopeptide repeat protein [Paenibacillus silvae]MDM5278181.1 tetratricopeptide repeat protein [Paenibacillus silvae]